ncbi:MAG: hypothetical protein LBF88_08700 [Planctomycetaceae bacterium]|nr:hypothetical protein [Planctomycetaceae bacterium]
MKLTHNGSSLQEATVSLILAGGNSPYLVRGNTNSNGIEKMETVVNVFSKSGSPSGTYDAVITHIPKSPSEVSDAELSKMSPAETDAYRKKLKRKLS